MVTHAFGIRPVTQSDIALHVMLNEAVVKVSEKANRNENKLVNLVSSDFFIGGGNPAFASLICLLLDSMMNMTTNVTVRLSAKTYSNITLLHLKTDTELNNPEFISCIQTLQPLANQIGATVELTSYRNNISTVAVSYISEGQTWN